MSPLSKRILLMLLVGLCLAAPAALRAQHFDASDLMRAQQRGQSTNLYGGNPYEQTGEENAEG